MNFFKSINQHLFGMKKGYQVYRQVIDTGKALAPIASPLAADILAANGLPTTAAAAVKLLAAGAKKGTSGLNNEIDAVAEYAVQHLDPVLGTSGVINLGGILAAAPQ